MWKGILYLLQIQLEDQESGQEFKPLLQENSTLFHLFYMFFGKFVKKIFRTISWKNLAAVQENSTLFHPDDIFLPNFSRNFSKQFLEIFWPTVQKNSTLFHRDDISWKIFPIHPDIQISNKVKIWKWELLRILREKGRAFFHQLFA